MKRKTTIILMCLFTLTAAAVVTFLALNGNLARRAPVMAEFYVSPSGSDTGNGSKGSPFASVAKARDEVRKINADMTGDIVVHLAEGEYVLADTLTFDERDGATNGYTVRYVGEGNAVLSGGGTLTGFALHDEEKGIYSVKVPEGVSFRQLYINGEKMIRSDTEHGYKNRIVGASRFLADGTLIPEWNNNWGGEDAAAGGLRRDLSPVMRISRFQKSAGRGDPCPFRVDEKHPAGGVGGKGPRGRRDPRAGAGKQPDLQPDAPGYRRLFP